MRIRTIITTLLLSSMWLGSRAQESKSEWRLGLIADPQYADKDDKGTRFYRSSLGKLDTATEFLNSDQVDFTIAFGDLVDAGIKDLGPVMQRLHALNAPVYNMLGNHDFTNAPDVDKLYKSFEMPSPYYAVEKGNWLFLLLNTNELSEYGTKEGSTARKNWDEMNNQLKAEKRSNTQPWNGGISAKQLQWMEKQLKRAKSKGKNVVVFTHHPLFPENGLEALNNREILSVLEKYPNVRAVISGHNHRGNFGTYKGIAMVTLEGMIETADQNAYGVLELYPDKMIIKGHGRMTSRTMVF